MRSLWYPIFLVILIWTLHGCTTLRQTVPHTTYDVEALTHWTLAAKIGWRSSNNNGSAYLDWQQQGDQYEIRLSGPLGQGTNLLKGNSSRVILTTHKNQKFYANKLEDLVQRHSDVPLPIYHLFAWIRGIPKNPNLVTNDHTVDSGIKRFTEAGWTIHTERYRLVDGYWLPHKLVLRQDKMRLTIVVNSWSALSALASS